MASWKETSPGHFERPFDSLEKFFLALARGSTRLNREHWSVSIFARFKMKGSIKNTESALRHAWKAMRYHHPQIACTACGDTIVYEIPDSAALEAWLDGTFITAPAPTTKEELLASFRPSALATLHYLPHNSEIIIHTSHWRMDFVGALSLLHNMFTALAEPRHIQFGDEAINLSPSRDEVAKFGLLDAGSPATAKERSKAAMDLVMQLFSNLPSIGLPTQNLIQTPRGTLRSGLVFEPSTTSAIVSASKARGLTVTTALHAALIVAVQQAAPISNSLSGKYTTLGIFNIRPLVQAPYNDSTVYPATLQLIGIPLTLEVSTYANLAAQLKQFYKQPMPPSAGSHIQPDIIVPYTNQMADLASQPPPANFPAPTEPMLSSIGIVDGYLNCNYGDAIEVKDFWIGVEMMTPQLVCYLWTWQGEMTLSACYNEAFYEREFVHGFLKRVVDVLFTELEIQKA